MKKLLCLSIILGLVCISDATVIDVVPAGLGSMGNSGLAGDPLVPGERLYVDIVLNHNPHPATPSYDGYLLSMFDVDLAVTGQGDLGTDPVRDWHSDLNLTADTQGVFALSNNVTDRIEAISINGVVGPAVLLHGLWVDCTGQGQIVLDLTLDNLTQYGLYNTWPGPGSGHWDGWIDLTDPELGDLIMGDLVVYTLPEPATITMVLLGVSWVLRRKRK